MKDLEKESRALLHTVQQARKEILDHRGRVDTVFQAGERILGWTRVVVGIRSRWVGPFHVIVLACPNAYILAFPGRFKCRPTVNASSPTTPARTELLSAAPVCNPGRTR
jgi:hypothetical protein